MPKAHKEPRQSTLDELPVKSKAALDIIQSKSDPIDITEMNAIQKEEDELEIKISFKLSPKSPFSRVKAKLWFDDQQINSATLRIPQGPLATGEFEFIEVLDMTGIGRGKHTLTVEMFGMWGLDEKLNRSTMQETIDYVPQTRMSRLVKIPSIKSVAGTDFGVTSKNENNIYQDIAKIQKKEQMSKRDNW